MSTKKNASAETADFDNLEEWEAREPNVAYQLVDGELVEVPTPAAPQPPALAGQPQGENDATQPPAQDHDVHDGRRPEVRQRRR
jgi:hypothetical protein